MTTASAAVVVVPRERFSFTERSLESLLKHTRPPFELIYIDGGSPDSVRRYLEKRSAEAGFRLIRRDQFLTPNQARNLGWRAASARHVVFVDNDVLVTPGWLEALVTCAEETGAWLVGPICCIGEPVGKTVHMAGGVASIDTRDGKRVLVEKHGHSNAQLDTVRAGMARSPSTLIEFHTALVRREVFERLGPLDENLMNTREHVDLSLAVQGAGGAIFFEPASLITYVPPPPFEKSDLAFYRQRWSEAWSLTSLTHFREKWKLGDDDPQLRSQLIWLRRHRQFILKPALGRVASIVGERVAKKIERKLVSPIEVLHNKITCRI